MLKSLHIKNFRGFRDLKIESLKRVNLITGQNNTGKTGIMEALVLLLDDIAPDGRHSANLPTLFRSAGGDLNENFWRWLSNNKNLAENIEINASLGVKNDLTLIAQSNPRISLNFDSAKLRSAGMVGNFPSYLVKSGPDASPKFAVFSTNPSNPVQDAIDYNRVVSKRRKKQVEAMLRQIEPRLESIEALQISHGPQAAPLIYAEISDLTEMIPVTQLGQGFNRILDIYSELVVGEAKVLLIDEIENGLHHSVLPLVWKGLFLAAKEFDVQIFATTHSWECILAADQTAREQESYNLELIRLDPVKEDIKATIIDQDALETAKEFKWEIR